MNVIIEWETLIMFHSICTKINNFSFLHDIKVVHTCYYISNITKENIPKKIKKSNSAKNMITLNKPKT